SCEILGQLTGGAGRDAGWKPGAAICRRLERANPGNKTAVLPGSNVAVLESDLFMAAPYSSFRAATHPILADFTCQRDRVQARARDAGWGDCGRSRGFAGPVQSVPRLSNIPAG